MLIDIILDVLCFLYMVCLLIILTPKGLDKAQKHKGVSITVFTLLLIGIIVLVIYRFTTTTNSNTFMLMLITCLYVLALVFNIVNIMFTKGDK